LVRHKTYGGRREGVYFKASANGKPLIIPLTQDQRFGGASAVGWGYVGGGPLRLAFAILFDLYGDEAKADRLHKAFRKHVLASLPRTKRFSLRCLGFSFLFRGVKRGSFSFQRERSEIMKADGLLISTKELLWQKLISACRSQLNE